MIECRNLSYRNVLDGISFTLPAGRCLSVVGRNGAGKTTLFHLWLRFKFYTSGTCMLAENRIGYVPERPYLPMEETFSSFLRLHLNLISFPKKEIEKELYRVSSMVGLERNLDDSFRKFSKGMLQKALLAQAMLGEPRLMILDEPMSGLDPDARTELKLCLKDLKSKGVTLVFSSHVMEDVRLLADDVLELENGKQIFFGTMSDWGKA